MHPSHQEGVWCRYIARAHQSGHQGRPDSTVHPCCAVPQGFPVLLEREGSLQVTHLRLVKLPLYDHWTVKRWCWGVAVPGRWERRWKQMQVYTGGPGVGSQPTVASGIKPPTAGDITIKRKLLVAAATISATNIILINTNDDITVVAPMRNMDASSCQRPLKNKEKRSLYFPLK